MKLLAVFALALLLLAAGCIGPLGGSRPAPKNETKIVPVPPAPVVKPAPPPFDPASLCGAKFGEYANKVYSVKPCGQGDYIVYRECCGLDFVAYVNEKGEEIGTVEEVRVACMQAGDDICTEVLGTEPIACPAAEVKSCTNYSVPVCARIVNKSGEAWFDFENNCLACKEGGRMGNGTAYKGGTCASNKIISKAEIEKAQKENIYADLVGKQLHMLGLHYGLASQEVILTVTVDDITSIEQDYYLNVPAWLVNVTRVMDGIPRTLQLYYSEDGTTLLQQVQTQ